MNFLVVIVHGPWHTLTHYSKIITDLKAEGVEVQCPALPSSCAHLGCRAADDFESHVDSDFLQEIFSELVLIKRREVFVVAHSSGLAACEAIREELSRRFRRRCGRKGGIIGLMGISSFFLEPGKRSGSIAPFIRAYVSLLCKFSDEASGLSLLETAKT